MSIPKSELMRRLREERDRKGIKEVRGIQAPVELHAKIKKAAERIISGR